MQSGSKKSKPTPADEAAAQRLRKIRDRLPRGERPTQEKIAGMLGNVTQGAVSQYLNGLIPLNYRAVLAFAEAYDCQPEDIRDDLPEMKAERGYIAAAKAHPPEEADPSEFDAIWNSYTDEQKAKLLRIAQAAGIETKPPMQLHEPRPTYGHKKRGAR